jgi:hypothetical protein
MSAPGQARSFGTSVGGHDLLALRQVRTVWEAVNKTRGSKQGGTMRQALLLAAAACVAAVVFAGSGSATIHPLMVGWVCGNASGEPPGQTPDATRHSANSTFRALKAAGIVVGETADLLPIFDLTRASAKFSEFTVVVTSEGVVESGIPSNQGALNCVNGVFTTG